MSRKTVSMIGNLTRDMMSDVMETSLKKPIQTGEFRKNPVEPAWRCPAEYIYELVKTEQFVMEYLKPKQAVTGRVILQLHGGGYIGPMKNIYRRFAVKYSQISFGADVLRSSSLRQEFSFHLIDDCRNNGFDCPIVIIQHSLLVCGTIQDALSDS